MFRNLREAGSEFGYRDAGKGGGTEGGEGEGEFCLVGSVWFLLFEREEERGK